MSDPSRRRPPFPLQAAICIVVGAISLTAHTSAAPPLRGLTAAPVLASAYDAILDADFAAVEPRLRPACPSVPVFCEVMQSVALWWQIALDPEDRRQDGHFVPLVERAIADAVMWTAREPERAEAWMARGAAYGARAQFRVLRRERIAAARDGKQIKEALERALALDPALHDAKYGIGLYRYYAAVAPAALRMLRWLFLLPGGDREEGLQQMLEARTHGTLMRSEADYQLHLIYLWYEGRPREALSIIEDLQRRHPRNPLFYLIEAEIHDVYFHDAKASAATLADLLVRVDQQRVNASTIALRRAESGLQALGGRSARR